MASAAAIFDKLSLQSDGDLLVISNLLENAHQEYIKVGRMVFGCLLGTASRVVAQTTFVNAEPRDRFDPKLESFNPRTCRKFNEFSRNIVFP